MSRQGNANGRGHTERRSELLADGGHLSRFGSRPGGTTLVGGVGVVWAFAALALTARVPGVALGLAVAVVWLVSGGWVAFAVAHVGALVVYPDGVSTFQFLPVELGLLVMLFGSLRDASRLPRVLGVSAATFGLVGGLALWTYAGLDSLFGAALVALAIGVTASYAVHRYELVRMGLLGGDRA